MAKVVGAVGACAAEGKYVAVRTAALGALEAVLDVLSVDDSDYTSSVGVLDLLASDPIPSIADRAKDARANLSRSETK
ncbi:hypothetical protein IWW38_003953 [Coemansia aciculifera]|uniref:Uncharacterized protein n=1 Tax=Coemansia aciculifera TaxID=417176 RepID=A0ACC1LZ76_9FUNG|nr:hypothetical protein IWW38_003953 [Coemansia aciculifera]